MTITLYTVVLRDNAIGIQCPRCSRISYNLDDVQHRYCGHCKVFLLPEGLAIRNELRHVHQCPGTYDDPHEFECGVMICRDQKVTRCWDHRMREPSERPRSA